MDYTQILKYFSSTAAITLGIVYLAKLVINKLLETRLEQYKNSLQMNTESFRHTLSFEADKFKQELNIKVVEHQIKYSKLYEERGSVIKLIYNLLLDLENSLNHLTTIFQGPDWITDNERSKKVIESTQNLRKELEQNRIFFTSGLCEKVEFIISDSNKISVEMDTARSNELKNKHYKNHNIPLSDEQLLKPIDTWVALEQKVQNEIKAARLSLAQEFRILIGVE